MYGAYDIHLLTMQHDGVPIVDKLERVRIHHRARHPGLLAAHDVVVQRIPVFLPGKGCLSVRQIIDSIRIMRDTPDTKNTEVLLPDGGNIGGVSEPLIAAPDQYIGPARLCIREQQQFLALELLCS